MAVPPNAVTFTLSYETLSYLVAFAVARVSALPVTFPSLPVFMNLSASSGATKVRIVCLLRLKPLLFQCRYSFLSPAAGLFVILRKSIQRTWSFFLFFLLPLPFAIHDADHDAILLLLLEVREGLSVAPRGPRKIELGSESVLICCLSFLSGRSEFL